ncbi:MAG: NUDIX hydrolase [Dehalococcoidia bacterium]
METEKVIDSRTVYEGRILTVSVEDIEFPSGKRTAREIIGHHGAVVIVAVDAEENTYLVRQYRSALKRPLLEVPAGKIDSGEKPEETAHRELIEEIGYSAGRLEALGGFYASPGYSTEYLYLFYATDMEPTGDVPDADEIAEVLRVPLAQIPGMISSGEICDGKSVAALLRVIHEI